MTVIGSNWWDKALERIGESRDFHPSETDLEVAKLRIQSALAKAECEKARALIRAKTTIERFTHAKETRGSSRDGR